WLCSPNTQLMASTTFDLPHPFGPTMHVVPVPLNVTTVRSQNDLNPVISTLRSFSKMSPLTLSFSDVRSTWRTFRKFAFFPVLCVQTHYTRRETTHRSLMEAFFSRCVRCVATNTARQDIYVIDKAHVWRVLSQTASPPAHGWRAASSTSCRKCGRSGSGTRSRNEAPNMVIHVASPRSPSSNLVGRSKSTASRTSIPCFSSSEAYSAMLGLNHGFASPGEMPRRVKAVSSAATTL